MSTAIAACRAPWPNETLEQVDPSFVGFSVHIMPKVNADEELVHHLVDLGEVDARYFGPRLVCVRVTVQ